MPTNEFLPYASGVSPNVLSQVAYAASAARTGGVVNGTADAELANKAWRQPANMAAALGMLINDYGLLDALDDGNLSNLEAGLLAAIRGAMANQLGLYFRKRLSTDTTFYVATTGSDLSGDGTSGAPWATIQHAFDQIYLYYDIAGFNCYVSLAAGSYAGASLIGPTVGGNIQLVGAGSTTVTVAGGTQNAISASFGARVKVSGFKTTSSAASGLFASRGGNIELASDIDFGACGGTAQMVAVHAGSNIYVSGNYKISGAAAAHALTDFGGAGIVYVPSTVTVTLTGTPAFSQAFAIAADNCVIDAQGITFSGSATGSRYLNTRGGWINTNGGGANYFPGNSAGSGANYA